MSFIKLLLFLCLIGGGYNYWQKNQTESTLHNADTSPNGFIALPPTRSTGHNNITIFAPIGCPKEGAQRAEALFRELERRNITATRSDSANFDMANPDQVTLQRLNAVMTGELPIVFVNGRGKANPTVNEVLAEYGGSSQ
jgi:hypothetical protein